MDINNQNEAEDEDYLERLNEERNAKYAEYPDKMVQIINKIRENPKAYADFIEDSIKYIVEEPDKEDETKTKLIFKKKVKVALNRGESAFHEAAEILRKMEPMAPLEFNGNICIPLPQDDEELKDPGYLREQVRIMKENMLTRREAMKVLGVAAGSVMMGSVLVSTGCKPQATTDSHETVKPESQDTPKEDQHYAIKRLIFYFTANIFAHNLNVMNAIHFLAFC